MSRQARRAKVALAIAALTCAACWVADDWTKQSGEMTIHVKLRARDPFPLADGRCTISARRNDEWLWHEVLDFVHDDFICLGQEDWHEVTPTVAFGSFNIYYLATGDGGRSWITWQLTPSSLPCKDCFGEIERVELKPDGIGEMDVHWISYHATDGPAKLRTSDYGKSWTLLTPPEAAP